MMYIWPQRCVTLMKRELLYLFPFGQTAWLFGSIFINRTDKKKAMSTMKSAGAELKHRNVSMTWVTGLRVLLSCSYLAFTLANFVPVLAHKITPFFWNERRLWKSLALTDLPPMIQVGSRASWMWFLLSSCALTCYVISNAGTTRILHWNLIWNSLNRGVWGHSNSVFLELRTEDL